MSPNGATEILGDTLVEDTPEPGVQFDLSKLSYADLRRVRKLDVTDPAALDLLEDVLDRAVIGGLGAVGATEFIPTFRKLMQTINEESSLKGQPAASSSAAFDAAESTTTAT